jgi:hypothetical protein
MTLAELNALVTNATLIDTGDSRLSDARTPTSHTHIKSEITDFTHTHTASAVTDFDTEVGNHTDVAANTTHRGLSNNPHTVTAAQVGNATAQWNADKIQDRDISASAPSSGQVLAWNTVEVAWTDQSGGGGGDFSAYEDEFTADSPDVNNRQTFTLTVTASVNANTPSGRNIVGVYRNGNKQKYIASDPGNREYSVPAGNQVTVGGLVTDDEIEIVYGG